MQNSNGTPITTVENRSNNPSDFIPVHKDFLISIYDVLDGFNAHSGSKSGLQSYFDVITPLNRMMTELLPNFPELRQWRAFGNARNNDYMDGDSQPKQTIKYDENFNVVNVDDEGW